MSKHIRPKLTGRHRYRVVHRWFRSDLVVLQLEVEGFVPEYVCGRVDGEITTWWGDARPEHVMQFSTATVITREVQP